MSEQVNGKTLCEWCDHPEKHNKDEPTYDPEFCLCDCHEVAEFVN